MKHFKTLFEIMTAVLTVFILASLLFLGCKKDEWGKDVQIKIRTDVIRVPLALRFYEANANATTGLPSDLDITISGPDADKLYTPALEKLTTIDKIQGGLMDVAVRSSEIISPEKPLRFTITARGKDYFPVVRHFVIADTTTEVQEIALLNLHHLPDGVKAYYRTTNADLNGLQAPVSIVEESVKMEIPEGTILKTAQGEIVTGEVSIRLLQFSANTPGSLEVFPGGLGNVMIKGASEPGFFQTAGCVAIEMEADGKAVKQFEGGQVAVTMKLPDSTMNFEAERPILPGDEIPLWSMDNTGEWSSEGSIFVQETGGQLTASWTQSHLSEWNIDWPGVYCRWGATLIFPVDMFPLWYTLEFVNATTNQVIKRSYYHFGPGANVVPLFLAPQSGWWRVRLALNGYADGLSQQFQACIPGNIQLIFASQININPVPLITVAMQGYCPDQPDLLVGPSVSVYYRISGQWNWSYLGTSENGIFQTGALTGGVTYDFLVSNGRQTYDFLNMAVPTSSSTNYVYVLPPMPFPRQFCDEF